MPQPEETVCAKAPRRGLLSSLQELHGGRCEETKPETAAGNWITQYDWNSTVFTLETGRFDFPLKNDPSSCRAESRPGDSGGISWVAMAVI